MTSLIRIELPLGQLGRLTGQTETLPPVDGQGSTAGRALEAPQVAAEIGDPVPIVFCRWRGTLPAGQRGGVTITPPATDGSFSNNSAGAVTARYQLLLSEGKLGGIQVRDVFQSGNRVGALTQAYGRRAGSWGPDYSMIPWGPNPAPLAPLFVGTGQGRFDDVTMGAFSITCAAGDETWRRQVHLFIREGMEVDRLIEEDRGPSDNLADLVVWALLRSGRVSAQLVDRAAMLTAAEFLNKNTLGFDGVIREPLGLLDWLTEVLPHYILRLVRSRGVYRLRPLLPTTETGDIDTGEIEWSRTFTVADIDVTSLRLATIPSADRRPVALLVKWRQQLEDSEAFIRTTTVRYGGSALGGPYEQVDLSAYCTNAGHAVVYGAFRLARRRYIEHRLTFRLKPSADSEAMAEGDIVRVILTATNADTGTVRIDQLYTVEQISRSPAGVATLELLHFPVDDQGRSLIALDVANALALDVSAPSGSGRGGPTLDSNSRTDTTVPPDPGPWPQWEPPAPSEPLYPVGDDLNWPADVEIPEIPPIGLGEIDPLDPLTPISDLNPSPVLPSPIPPVGDGWGPGRIPVDDIALTLPADEGYVAAVSFDQVRLTYPDVFYRINALGAVALAFRVTVDNPPVGRALSLVVTDGATDEAWPVVIPVGETSALLAVEAFTSTETVLADAERSLTVLSHSGGGYRAPAPTEENPEPVAVTTTPSAFTVRVYVGTVTLQTPGLWTWDGTAWDYAGGASLGDWTWDVVDQRWEWGGSSADWTWAPADARWEFDGTVPTGWEWLLAAQRWRRTAPETDPGDRPEGPPAQIPSPIPSSAPAGAGQYTVVAQASVDKVPIGGPDDDLVLALTDYGESGPVESAGALTIAAVSMRFGAWRWNPATSSWEHLEDVAGWRWSAAEATWVYLLDSNGWTWNQATEAWEGGSSGMPGLPPLQNSSTHPPDAERWLYDSAEREWSGTAHILGGTAPVFDGLLYGSFTYHRPLI